MKFQCITIFDRIKILFKAIYIYPNLNAPAVKYCSKYVVVLFCFGCAFYFYFFYTLVCTYDDVNIQLNPMKNLQNNILSNLW